MFNLNGKKSDEMVNGMLYLKVVPHHQLLDELMAIDSLLGNDIFETQLLADAISHSAVSGTIHVPVLTDKRTWQKIKDSGLKLIATKEKAVA